MKKKKNEQEEQEEEDGNEEEKEQEQEQKETLYAINDCRLLVEVSAEQIWPPRRGESKRIEGKGNAKERGKGREERKKVKGSCASTEMRKIGA